MLLEILTSEAFYPLCHSIMNNELQILPYYQFSLFLPLLLFFTVMYFLFYVKMRTLTRNIQIYAHAHGKEPADYLWNLDQTLTDCLQHFVRLFLSPVIWHRFFPSWKAFPSLCLVCQLRSSDWQSRLTLHWSSPPSPCQGDRWNERNRNQ